MNISNNLVKSETYSLLDLKDGRFYIYDSKSENEKLSYLTDRTYDKSELERTYLENFKKDIATYKLTAFQHHIISYLSSKKEDIIKINNIEFLNDIDFYKDVYHNTKSTQRYNKEFLDLAITRIFFGKDKNGNEIKYVIQPISFKIIKKPNGHKTLEVSLNPFLKRDLQVGYQRPKLTKDENYNRFLMLMNTHTMGFKKHTYAITSNNLAYAIFKTKEHLRTKTNRHNKILTILELFTRENPDKRICYLKFRDNSEIIVYYSQYLPYRKDEIQEIYFQNGELYE